MQLIKSLREEATKQRSCLPDDPAVDLGFVGRTTLCWWDLVTMEPFGGGDGARGGGGGTWESMEAQGGGGKQQPVTTDEEEARLCRGLRGVSSRAGRKSGVTRHDTN